MLTNRTNVQMRTSLDLRFVTTVREASKASMINMPGGGPGMGLTH